MDVPLSIAYCAPDQGLIAELTVAEHVALHQKLRIPLEGMGVNEGLEWARLETKRDVLVRDLSSGMRQRLALTLAFSTASSALFLDEPTSHLDSAGRAWYAELMKIHRKGRTVVVASNHDPAEFPGADRTMELSTP
jgi:ABC-2 type transport system ATP-binding protein